jgi:hypothetical protein
MKSVEQAHPRQARLADLRGADQVEIANARRLLGRALMLLDNSQSPRARREQIADIALRVTKMPPRLWVRQKFADLIMRVGCRQSFDQRPELGKVSRAIGPFRE